METQQPIIIGKLYADWCMHCKNLEPIWKNLKEDLKDKIENKELEIVEFEETKDQSKLEEFKLKHPVEIQGGYPTLFKIDKQGNITYYSGERELEALKNWATETNGPEDHSANESETILKHPRKSSSKKSLKKTLSKKHLKKRFSKKNLRKTFKKILQKK
jgi:thiol-disulfide isomerase/thioredoxin